MNAQTPAAGPFTHEAVSITRTMGLVILALLPATAFGIYEFGWPALFTWLLCIIAALIAEAVSLRIAGKPVRPYLMDGSALLTAWLLAMSLPPWTPWWISVVGSVFAIVVAKQIFGGIGQNLFNPAMAARVTLLISFPLEMTTWVAPKPLFSKDAPGFIDSLRITFGNYFNIDTMSSASVLGHVKTELTKGTTLADAIHSSFHPMKLLIGTVPGSMGETSAVLLLAGGIFLLAKRIISWHIPVSMIASLMLIAGILHFMNPQHYPSALYHLLSGATFLTAFFIATDLVTSPITARGQLLFGAGIGALMYVIRTWANFPEGAGFSVLLMNALTPLIDHYIKPRIYGRTRKGEPLQYADNVENSNG